MGEITIWDNGAASWLAHLRTALAKARLYHHRVDFTGRHERLRPEPEKARVIALIEELAAQGHGGNARRCEGGNR